MIDCLQELQAAHILPTKNKKNGNPNADEIPKNDNKWYIHENEVPILIKKHSSEG